MRRLLSFVDATGLTAVEIDGPYEGAVCNSTVHRHHQGLGDSQIAQWRAQMRLLRDLAKRRCYLLVPDPFYLHGTHKIGMGYDEQQYNLPREEWLTLARQQMHDNTFDKLPSQGWMMIPLVEYHGGGAQATIEPFGKRSLADWEVGLIHAPFETLDSKYCTTSTYACACALRVRASPRSLATSAFCIFPIAHGTHPLAPRVHVWNSPPSRRLSPSPPSPPPPLSR